MLEQRNDTCTEKSHATDLPQQVTGRPHVHVFGDLAEIQLYRRHASLPDHVDPTLTAYRKLKGFVKRAMPGGAWSVAQFVRAALGDVWKCDSTWTGSLSALEFNGYRIKKPRNKKEQQPKEQQPISSEMWGVNLGAVTGDSDYFWRDYSLWEAKPKGTEIVHEMIPREQQEGTIKVADVVPRKYYGLRQAAGAFDYDGGIVAGHLESDNTATSSTLSSSDDWSPSITLWPRKARVHAAVRKLPLKTLFESARESGSGDRLDRESPNVGAIAPDVEAIWRKLKHEHKKLLESFLKLSEEASGISESESEKVECSRIVLLVDQEWTEGKECSCVDQYHNPIAGYLIVRGDCNEWAVWASRCECIMGEMSEESDPGFECTTPRFRFDFSSMENKRNGDLKAVLFGIPISPSFARMFRPIRRPTPDFVAPLGLVTSSELIGDCADPNVALPTWIVDRRKRRYYKNLWMRFLGIVRRRSWFLSLRRGT